MTNRGYAHIVAAATIGIIAALLVAVTVYWQMNREEGQDPNIAAIQRHGLRVVSKPSGDTGFNPVQLTDAYFASMNGSLTRDVCAKGGYDLYAHRGSGVVTTRGYPITGRYQDAGHDEPLQAIVMWNDVQILCVYKSVVPGSELVPGIFAAEEDTVAPFDEADANTNASSNTNDQVYCTADAKECPDGSFVGRVGPNCAFAPCSQGIVNTNSSPEMLPAGVERFTSDTLGITFTYRNDDTQRATVSEQGDKAYIAVNLPPSGDITGGQWVQVFDKEAGDTLAQAIEKRFLQGYDEADCFVKSLENTGYPDGVSLAIISFPHTDDGVNPWWDANTCPGQYSETNGMRYFWMDAAHPDKLLYFDIGQYAIYGTDDQTTDWPRTLRILE